VFLEKCKTTLSPGNGGTEANPNIIVAIIGIVVVAVIHPQVLRIVVDVGTTTHHLRSIPL